MLVFTPMRIDPSNTGQIPPAPSNPFHVARAYGVRPQIPAVEVDRAGSIGRIQPEQPRPALPSVSQSLIAGVVPGAIEFAGKSEGAAQPSSPALQMYRHPADKNAAATAVQVGRRLDTSG